MPNPRMKQRRVVHKSTAGILKPIPEAVDLVGNPPPRLTTKTVALLLQRGSANRGLARFFMKVSPESDETGAKATINWTFSRMRPPVRIPFAPPTSQC